MTTDFEKNQVYIEAGTIPLMDIITWLITNVSRGGRHVDTNGHIYGEDWCVTHKPLGWIIWFKHSDHVTEFKLRFYDYIF